MNTKREVWEAAKECGLDDFIAAASRIFDGDIAGIKLQKPDGEVLTYMRGVDENGKRG